jgi:hypothetical protein
MATCKAARSDADEVRMSEESLRPRTRPPALEAKTKTPLL